MKRMKHRDDMGGCECSENKSGDMARCECSENKSGSIVLYLLEFRNKIVRIDCQKQVAVK